MSRRIQVIRRGIIALRTSCGIETDRTIGHSWACNNLAKERSINKVAWLANCAVKAEVTLSTEGDSNRAVKTRLVCYL